jgi:hypothetical protein
MGSALLIFATLMLLGMQDRAGWRYVTHLKLGDTGSRSAAGNFILGALMPMGIGLYARPARSHLPPQRTQRRRLS